MDETPYRLAYEVATRAVDDQARVLEELRSRAGTLIAATAIATSFLGGEALARDDGISVVSPTGVALACFVISSLLALGILWPFRFGFSLSSREMLREVAIRLELNYDSNADRIKPLFWLLRGAILFLLLEIAAWIVVLWRL